MDEEINKTIWTIGHSARTLAWWRCHRSMDSDYLMVRGWEFMHIMGIGKAEEHHYTAPAGIVDGVLTCEENKRRVILNLHQSAMNLPLTNKESRACFCQGLFSKRLI